MNIDRRHLWKEAFGDTDAFLNLFSATAYSPERSRSITIGGNLAAALYWLDCSYNSKKIAYIYAVATAKICRGQGLCHQLMTATHDQLKQRGYAGAILVPGSKALFDLYEGMGYRICSKIQEIACVADEPVACRQIDKEEYAIYRRQYLPLGGVIQEGASLDFLAGQASFYMGDDFLLTARREDDDLYGLELLGNTAATSGIVTALGCKRGTFRAVGQERPFAMYYSIADTEMPAYFGLAFD